VGIRAAQVADILVTVGPLGKVIAKAAADTGFNQNKVFSFPGSGETIKFLGDFLTENDVVLIKGSRGMHMDKIVSALEAGS